MRIVPVPQTGEVASLEHGEFEALFAAAERQQVPVFAWVPGRASLLEPYIRRFPKLQFIIDHCGVGVAPVRIGELPVTMATSVHRSWPDRVAQLERVCDLAQYPNVALKWCHAPGLLSEEDYPYRDLMPLLRTAIEAFGAERIMWASDYTVARDQNGNSWAQCLYYFLDADQLTRPRKSGSSAVPSAGSWTGRGPDSWQRYWSDCHAGHQRSRLLPGRVMSRLTRPSVSNLDQLYRTSTAGRIVRLAR